MTLLAYYRLPLSTYWEGAHLVAVIKTEAPVRIKDDEGLQAPRPEVVLTRSSGTYDSGKSTKVLGALELKDRWLVTSQLAAGEYDLAITSDPGGVLAEHPERLIVLDSEAFALASELDRREDEFLAPPFGSAEDTLRLMESIVVRRLASERYELDSEFDRRLRHSRWAARPAVAPEGKLSGSDLPMPLSQAGWLTEVAVDIFRQLAVTGIRSYRWRIYVYGEQHMLAHEVSVKPTVILNQTMQVLFDERFGTLSGLTASGLASVDVDTEGGEVRFRISTSTEPFYHPETSRFWGL